MKKYILALFCSCLTLVLLTSCNQNKKQLRQLVSELNSECPIPLGAIGQMDNALYNGRVVTFNYSVSGMGSIDQIKAREEQFHQFMLDNYRNNSDEGFRQLLEAIVAADADLEVVMHLDNGESYSFHFSNSELKNNMPQIEGDPESYLVSAVESTKMQLPISYGQGMECSQIILDETAFTYIIECDEDLLNMDEMHQSTVENHALMVEMMTGSVDPSFIKLMSSLRATHRALRYLYIGKTSGKEAVVEIAPEELK